MRPHTSASLQWWQTACNLKLFQILLTASIWHHLTSVCLRLSRKLSMAFTSDEIKFKLLQQNGFENSLQSYTALGLEKVFKAGGVTLNKRETTLKNEVPKLSTHSELYYTFWAIFCVLFHVDTLSGSKDTHVKALLSNILCANPFGDAGNKLSLNDTVSQEQLIIISGGQEMSSFHWTLKGHIFPHRSTTTNFQIQSHTNTFCILHLCSYISRYIF